MNLRGRPSWTATTALAIVLISMLGFLYVRTQTHDAVAYFANVAILRQLKQLDARWELNVLKSRMGIDLNYDSLVDPLTDLNQRLGELQANLAAQGQQDVDEKSGCGALRRDSGLGRKLRGLLGRAADGRSRIDLRSRLPHGGEIVVESDVPDLRVRLWVVRDQRLEQAQVAGPEAIEVTAAA